jgi:hypothetical protein
MNTHELTPEEVANVQAMQRDEGRLRGAYLSAAAWIEAILSDCIASYSCPNENRRRLFFSEVLAGGPVMFRSKIEILASIRKAMDGTYERKSDPLIRDLASIKDLRNRFAHCHIDTSPEAIRNYQKGSFKITFYEEGVTKHQEITQDFIQERLDKMMHINIELLKLLEKIKGA